MQTSFGPIDISLASLMMTYFLIIGVSAAVQKIGVEMSRPLLTSVFRMSLQLGIMGYILVKLFEYNHWAITILAYSIMIFLATRMIVERSGLTFRGIDHVIGLSLGSSVTLIITFLITFVLKSENSLESRHIIPLGGMILCNSMSGAALAIERFFSGLRTGRNEYETFLSLGATIEEASFPWFSQAFQASLTPMLITMSSAGLITLPGMMVGQILCGVSPLIAIKYQIVILIAMTASVSITSLMSLRLAKKYFFTPEGLLRDEIFRNSKIPLKADMRPIKGGCGGGGGGACRGI